MYTNKNLLDFFLTFVTGMPVFQAVLSWKQEFRFSHNFQFLLCSTPGIRTDSAHFLETGSKWEWHEFVLETDMSCCQSAEDNHPHHQSQDHNHQEFVLATNMSSCQSAEDKLRWAFRMYDKDGSGKQIASDDGLYQHPALEHLLSFSIGLCLHVCFLLSSKV